MRFIGITGGVGAGKSAILAHLAQRPRTRVMLADEIAHELMEPGGACYEKIREVFAGEDIFAPRHSLGKDETGIGNSELLTLGDIDRGKLATVIFSDQEKRERLNAIVHPAVKEYVKQTAAEERQRGELDLLVLEAALLIEEHYDEICDELWYIYTREEIRKARLMESRGYSEEKVYRIFSSQLPEMEYRSHCRSVIDNNGTVEDAFLQIDALLAAK